MATEDGKKALADSGLRPADGSRTPDQKGVGSVAALKPASAETVQRTLKGWSLQAIPFRSLVVMDVSGSMNFQAGGQTRMQLTQQAAIAGSKLFPNTAALGMWAFSIGLGGGSQDYVELDPIRKMDQVVGGVTQRDRLVADISGLDKRTGGATGLYDSTLAAYRTVKANYDARAVNSVILFTDGANEDPDSLSLEELLEALRARTGPGKARGDCQHRHHRGRGRGDPAEDFRGHRRHKLCGEESAGHPERVRGCTAGSSTIASWPTAASGAFRDLKTWRNAPASPTRQCPA